MNLLSICERNKQHCRIIKQACPLYRLSQKERGVELNMMSPEFTQIFLFLNCFLLLISDSIWYSSIMNLKKPIGYSNCSADIAGDKDSPADIYKRHKLEPPEI